MADFNATSIALAGTFPTNEIITDDKGMPGIYVKRAKKTLNELLSTADTTVHPAFVIGNDTKDVLHFGKFQGKSHNSRIYSLPAEDPAGYINLDTMVQYCRNKGAGHHCITAAEWAFLALLAKKNNTQPKGNNNYGKDSTETGYIAIPSMARDSSNRIQRVATGTGPKTWSDTHDLDGIYDLNGNVWEWVAGIRFCYGELQVIPYNNAADPSTDMSLKSTAWKAINAAATGYSDLFIDYDKDSSGNPTGQTTGSVKIDYVSSHWQWDTSITSQSDSSRNAPFKNTTCSSNIGVFAKLFLQAMALMPEANDTDYGDDYIYGNNGAAERCAYRGGSWGSGSSYGVFALYFYNGRDYSSYAVGGRPAYYEQTGN